MQDLHAKLQYRRAQKRYRTRQIAESWNANTIQISDRSLVSFCSNDYLGLAQHPKVKQAFIAAAAYWGVGAGAAHLICGHTRAHHALEEELAAFTGREKALLFSTGYMANLGIAAALLTRHDSVCLDKLNHASLTDAARLSGARMHRYPHADTLSLGNFLQKQTASCLIMTDGVFSMDGDLAPLPALSALAKKNNAWLMVDDAHGLGVLGTEGRGTLSHFGLSSQAVPILMGTLGKAFGTFGAFVAGDTVLIETLIQHARTFTYTTALPPAIAEATRASLHLLQHESWRRERLAALITRFKKAAQQCDLPLLESQTPIQALRVGESEPALALSAQLHARGFLVTAIRPPTVPAHTARLRITLSATHTEEQVDQLIEAIGENYRR